jgi:prephenate dehydrogenase
MNADGGGRRAAVVGTGLIGGSVAAALRANGWWVTGSDANPEVASEALSLGVVDVVGTDLDADLTFLAVPVGSVAEVAEAPLAAGSVVTDVAGVKAPVLERIEHPRFIGGHPMAGSEDLGVSGARADLFQSATWVITPTQNTDADALRLVHQVVRSFGADVVNLGPAEHDRLVATVSHVPHLTAATLMGVASAHAEEEKALLRLAAGGFRDMTRVAAGDPRIWLDICRTNSEAIVDVFDSLLESLTEMRDVVATGDAEALRSRLDAAQVARRNLPVGAPAPEELSEVRILVADRPGELAAVTTLATTLDVNVYDIEVAHAAELPQGQLILVVGSGDADKLAQAVAETSRSASVHPLGETA